MNDESASSLTRPIDPLLLRLRSDSRAFLGNDGNFISSSWRNKTRAIVCKRVSFK